MIGGAWHGWSVDQVNAEIWHWVRVNNAFLMALNAAETQSDDQPPACNALDLEDR